MNQINHMLVIKFKLKGGILIEHEMEPPEAAKWINAHSLEDRIQVFRDINLNYEKIDQLKKVFVKINDDMTDAELSQTEMFILLTTFESLSNKIKKRIKKLNKSE